MSNSDVSLEDCRQNLRLSKQTVFNWRHKGISALKGIENDDITGIAEFKILEMVISRKGEKINFDEQLSLEEKPKPKKRLLYRIQKEDKKIRERDKKYHTHTIQNLINGFSTWLSRFRGVATKYLQNYLNWYLIEVQYKGFKQYLDLFMMLSIYNRYIGIENLSSK